MDQWIILHLCPHKITPWFNVSLHTIFPHPLSAVPEGGDDPLTHTQQAGTPFYAILAKHSSFVFPRGSEWVIIMKGREKLPVVSTSEYFGWKVGGYCIIRKGCCAILRCQNRRRVNNTIFYFCINRYGRRSVWLVLWTQKLVVKIHILPGI